MNDMTRPSQQLEREELARLLPAAAVADLSPDRHCLLKDHVMNNVMKNSDQVASRRRLMTRTGAPLALVAAAAVVAVGVSTQSPFDGKAGSRTAASAGNSGLGSYALAAAPLAYKPIKGSDPKDLLESIAARTAALPNDSGTGRYRHMETQGWYLRTTIRGNTSTSAVVPSRTSEWLARDGSGRRVTTGVDPRTGDKIKGKVDQLTAEGGMGPLLRYPTEPRALAAILDKKARPVGELDAVRDAYRAQPLAPAVRAAMLRYLADADGLTVSGNVTDRAGRKGIGFSVESDAAGLPARYTMIIDPANGKVLGEEEMLTKDAGKLNVRIPSMISYTVYLSAEFTSKSK
jgi:hypothetical protein